MTIIDLNKPGDTGTLNFKSFRFKSGEAHNKILETFDDEVLIRLRFHDDAQLMHLFNLTNALRGINKHVKINLEIPYFPGARQDRICDEGEAMSVEVYAQLINSQNYETVRIFDPHSEVTPALIHNRVVFHNYNFVRYCIEPVAKQMRTTFIEEFVRNSIKIISPDAGSNKKIFGVTKHLTQRLGYKFDVIRADKLRDVGTGEILETIVYADDKQLQSKYCFIIDDIISGGRTFMELAKILKAKGASRVYLLVTHHEGVADYHKLKESGIDYVFCTDSMGKNVQVANIADELTTQYPYQIFLH